MKRYILLIAIFFTGLTVFAQNKFSSMAGQEAEFNSKYKLSASIDESTMTLKFTTDAPVTKAILSTYTAEQLSVRKGTDNIYPFKEAVNSYQFNLNAPVYKGYLAYWLKVYTSDGVWQEYFFKRKSTTNTAPPAIRKPVATTAATAAAGGTKIKTNIACDAGKNKVITALKEMDGVFNVSVDTKSGILTIDYSSDGTPYTEIISTINKNGFDADGKKASAVNPCSSNNPPAIRRKN